MKSAHANGTIAVPCILRKMPDTCFDPLYHVDRRDLSGLDDRLILRLCQ